MLALEPGELTPPTVEISGRVDDGLEARVHLISQPANLGGGEEPLLLPGILGSVTPRQGDSAIIRNSTAAAMTAFMSR